MAWAAIIFSTSVKDDDHDGLPDGLEDASGGLLNPPITLPTLANPNPAGEPLPNVNAMGASSGHPDLFVEVNGMRSDGWDSLTTGQVPTPGPHNHLPTPEVLKLVGDAYNDSRHHTAFRRG